jgi:uracil-DNA glycosylase
MSEEKINKEILEEQKKYFLNSIHSDWKDFFEKEMEKDYFEKLLFNLYKEIEIEKNIVYPDKENWFNVLKISKDNLKIIIIGQDPYHGENQAHGFSFSVLPGIKTPPSLKNMYKEIKEEYQIEMNMNSGTLTPWVEQGVMLLNSILTVRAKTPASHKDYGWNYFTDNLISYISEKFNNKVFFLWGAFAKNKAGLINEKKHKVLESAHPSPFSAHNGFFGNNHFKLANKYLVENGISEINWKI